MFELYCEHWSWEDREKTMNSVSKKSSDFKPMKIKSSTIQPILYYTPDPESDDEDPAASAFAASSTINKISPPSSSEAEFTVPSSGIPPDSAAMAAVMNFFWPAADTVLKIPPRTSLNTPKKRRWKDRTAGLIAARCTTPTRLEGESSPPPRPRGNDHGRELKDCGAKLAVTSSNKAHTPSEPLAYDVADSAPVVETLGCCRSSRRALTLAEREALQEGLVEAAKSSKWAFSESKAREEKEEAKLSSEVQKTEQLQVHVMSQYSQPEPVPIAKCLVAGRLKLLLVGDSGVGKTTLLRQFCQIHSACGEGTSPSPLPMDVEDSTVFTSGPTLGIDFQSRIIGIGNNKSVKVQVWDTAGDLNNQQMAKAYYWGSHGILVVYDVTSPLPLSNVRTLLESVRQNTDSRTAFIALVANKRDLLTDPSWVTLQEGEKDNPLPMFNFPWKENGRSIKSFSQAGKDLAREYSAKFFETSALCGINVEDTFASIIKRVYEQNYTKNGAPRASFERNSFSVLRGKVVKKKNSNHPSSSTSANEMCCIS